MAYTRNPTWQDFPATTTPITAAALEHIEAGLEAAALVADNALAGGGAVDSVAGKTGVVTLVAADLTDSTTVGRGVVTATDAAAARTAIGAGTSSLSLGATSSTAAPGNHTHPASEVTDFAEAVDDRVASLIVAGSGITKTYDDTAGTLTLAATGGFAPLFGMPFLSYGLNQGTGWCSLMPAMASCATDRAHASILIVQGISIPKSITIDQVAVNVTTPSATAGATLRIGLLDADSGGKPTTVFADWGTVVVDSTGVKTITLGSALTIPAGNYFVASSPSTNEAKFEGWTYGRYVTGSGGLSAFGYAQPLGYKTIAGDSYAGGLADVSSKTWIRNDAGLNGSPLIQVRLTGAPS